MKDAKDRRITQKIIMNRHGLLCVLTTGYCGQGRGIETIEKMEETTEYCCITKLLSKLK